MTLDVGRGRYAKYAPLAFTEHGVAMLSAVLRSDHAVRMSILIVRAFVKLRELLATHKDLAGRIEKLEQTQKQHTSVLIAVVEDIKKLRGGPPAAPKRRIGFHPPSDE